MTHNATTLCCLVVSFLVVWLAAESVRSVCLSVSRSVDWLVGFVRLPTLFILVFFACCAEQRVYAFKRACSVLYDWMSVPLYNASDSNTLSTCFVTSYIYNNKSNTRSHTLVPVHTKKSSRHRLDSIKIIIIGCNFFYSCFIVIVIIIAINIFYTIFFYLSVFFLLLLYYFCFLLLLFLTWLFILHSPLQQKQQQSIGMFKLQLFHNNILYSFIIVEKILL